MKSGTILDLTAIHADKISQPSTQVKIHVPSGVIALFEPGADSVVYELDKRIPPGEYALNIYYLKDELMEKIEAQPTLGINYLELNISEQQICYWVEAKNVHDEPPIDPEVAIGFVITDRDALKQISSIIPSAVEQSYTEGVESIGKDSGWAIYLGEIALEQRFYWALDKDQNPVKLTGYFRYEAAGDRSPVTVPELEEELSGFATFTLSGISYRINTQSLGQDNLEINTYSDTCYIKQGNDFSIKISKLLPNISLDTLAQKAKSEAMSSTSFKGLIIDEPQLCLWEKTDRLPSEFRFFWYTQLDKEKLEIVDNYSDGPFSFNAIEKMKAVALTTSPII